MVAVSAAASIGGALISSSGAGGAANTQAAGQAAATKAQMDMFNKTQENLKPYMQTGGYANTALAQLMGLGPNGGGYDQGAYQNALNAYNAAGASSGHSTGFSGNILSGGTGRSGGPQHIQDIVLENGTVIPATYIKQQMEKAGLSGNAGIVAADSLTAGSALPAWLTSTGGSANGSGSASGSGTAPKLEDFPIAGKGPLDSPLLKAITMDQATLEKTPGYQFNLKQGLKSTQNAAAARGLGSSGAALKGAATFATGLADSTYQNQFQNAITNQQNQYNRLFDVTNLGANTAAGLGGIGQKTGENLANTYIGGANSQAASQIAGANAMGSGIQSAANQFGGGGLYGNALNGGGGTSGYGWNSYDPMGAGPWSDRDLKENIIPLGMENGHKIYEFSYLWSPERYIGVMAQDLLNYIPQAVRKIGRFFAVDYSQLGIEFRRA